VSLFVEERASDSPYVESIMYGRTLSNGSALRPAECHWHMVFVRHPGGEQALVVGPLTSTGHVSWGEGAEILWIKFKLGTYIPHLPAETLLDKETALPEAACKSFWLKGAAWQFPNHENADTFVNKLVREDVLERDAVVGTVLQDHPHDLSPRTVRHRFLRTTGMTQSHIRQIERAQRAAALLAQGYSILDTVYETGYFDQPHLVRSLKRWIGHTPTQLQQRAPERCRSIQDRRVHSEYDVDVFTLREAQ